MNDQWVKLDFEYSLRHEGFEVDFYHDENESIEMLPEEQAAYEASRDNARMFIQNRDDVAFSAAEMLAWFLQKTETELADHVPPEMAAEAAEKGRSVNVGIFPINMTPGSFYMRTSHGDADIKLLKLFIEYTVSPKRQ